MIRTSSLTTLLTRSVAIFSFAASLCLVGCGGWSSSATQNPPGSGTPPPSEHTVDLSWTPSTSPDISGYNIYRAQYAVSCGSFSRINSALNMSTSYTDSEVTNGASYCYATTAVNSRNEESSYSNIAINVQIPSQ